MKILDVGCGPGIYVDALNDLGMEATGIDLDRDNPYLKIDIFSDEFLQHQGYDLTLCLEVAEHLPEDKADEFVRRLCQTSDVIIFSAAAPGQGGFGHINCQPKEYWQQKFHENNFSEDIAATNDIISFMQQGYHMGWFTNNVMIMRSYGKLYYQQIIEEERPQAIRLADYIVNNMGG